MAPFADVLSEADADAIHAYIIDEARKQSGRQVTMKLTDSEQAMLDGREGRAQQKAMELLVRYAEALGAERFVDTTNVAGVPGSSNPYLQNYYRESGNTYDAIFSHFDLDSDELVEVPRVVVHSCHLQGGLDPDNWQRLGGNPEAFQISQDREHDAAERGIRILKTCTPYLAGNVPVQRRALRVDGIVRGGVLQFRHRRAYQH